jgi:hypothetical protein
MQQPAAMAMFFQAQASRMNPKIEELLIGIRRMEEDLEVQMALARADLKVRIEDPKFRSRSHKLLIPLCGKSGFVTTTTR